MCGEQQQGKEQDRNSQTVVMFMDTEMRFSRPQFAEAFKSQISEKAKERVWAYYVGRSSANAVRLLGLKSRASTYRDRLVEIARQMGATTPSELFTTRPKRPRLDGRYLKDLIEKQEFRCAISGVVLTPDTAALDHVIPFEQGGKHEPQNVQWVHDEVNRMKGQMREAEFIEWCRKIAAWRR